VRNTLSFAVICRLIANLCSVATAFISIRLYSHYLSKEIYGTIQIGLMMIGYLPLMSGGFRMALNQQTLAERDPARAQLIARFGQTLQTYFFVIVLLGGMVLMALYSQLPKTQDVGLPVMLYVATGLGAAITFQAGSQLALLVAFGEQVTSSLLQGAWGLVGIGIAWIVFVSGGEAWALPISTAGGALLVILAVRIALARVKSGVPLFVWRRDSDFWLRFRDAWRAAFDCLYFQVTATLLFSLDVILVGNIIGFGVAALYVIVARVMGISRQLLQSLSEAAWPRLAQEQDADRKAQTMRKVDRLNAWLVGAWYGAMIPVLLPFLAWLAKPTWVASPTLMVLLVSRNFLTSVINPHAYGLLSAARFRDLAMVSQREVITGVIAGLIFSRPLGAEGMALGFLIGTATSSGFLMTRRYFQAAHDTHWLSELFAVYWRAILAAAISLGISSAAAWLVFTRCHASGWAALPAGGLAFGLPAAAVLLRWRMSGKVP